MGFSSHETALFDVALSVTSRNDPRRGDTVGTLPNTVTPMTSYDAYQAGEANLLSPPGPGGPPGWAGLRTGVGVAAAKSGKATYCCV